MRMTFEFTEAEAKKIPMAVKLFMGCKANKITTAVGDAEYDGERTVTADFDLIKCDELVKPVIEPIANLLKCAGGFVKIAYDAMNIKFSVEGKETTFKEYLKVFIPTEEKENDK